jgi:hypothetical protein
VPNVRDDRDTPLLGERDGEAYRGDLGRAKKRKSFCRQDWTGEITLIPKKIFSPPGGPFFYRADRNATANTASHPTMTKEATAPAVILSFSFVV